MKKGISAISLLILMVVLGALPPATAHDAGHSALVIVIDSADFYPYYYRENGKLVGPMPEVTRAVLSQMGYTAAFLEVPWARAVDLVKRRQVDAIAGIFHRKEREAFVHYPDQFPAQSQICIIVPAESEFEFDGTLSQLKGHDIGAVLGWTYGLFREPIEVRRIDFEDEKLLVRNIAMGRIGMGIGNPTSLARYAEEQGLAKQIRLLEPPIESTPLYTAFSHKPGHDDLAGRFASALKKFKETPRFQEIMQRHGLGK
ncbi:MAG: transporter substrate-binding domain-containing protein [Sedimenticola sp.]